jgi:biotin carboxyl carrier protein
MELDYRDEGGATARIRLTPRGDTWEARIEDRTHTVEVVSHEGGRLALLLDGRSLRVDYARSRDGLEIGWSGHRYRLTDAASGTSARSAGAARTAGDGRIRTPMPGKIVAVHVAEGDRVGVGQALLILESMKMQNDVAADMAGTVAKICRAQGDNVDYGDVLVEIVPDPAEPAGAGNVATAR